MAQSPPKMGAFYIRCQYQAENTSIDGHECQLRHFNQYQIQRILMPSRANDAIGLELLGKEPKESYTSKLSQAWDTLLQYLVSTSYNVYITKDVVSLPFVVSGGVPYKVFRSCNIKAVPSLGYPDGQIKDKIYLDIITGYNGKLVSRLNT